MERAPLLRRLPPRGQVDAESLLEGFLDYTEEAGLRLYDHQEEAILEIFEGRHVVLNTPTGSGKSLVATAMLYKALAEEATAFYTAPIKALVAEKFFDLCRLFGPEQLGMVTGDASVNRDAPLLVCTAEILMNTALREGARAEADYVVMDEFHYYADRERGVAWQVPLLTLPQATFLLMSATFGETAPFERSLRELNGKEVAVVRSFERPVPLDFEYRETPIQQTVAELHAEGLSPLYIVHFSQRAASEQAQNLSSLDFIPTESKRAIREELHGFRFDTPFGKELRRLLPQGIGVHHAGMLPKYRRLVERLAQKGRLKVICGTDTLGVGVNVPIRTVVLTRLCKYDGEKVKRLTVREFQQIAGRAGRRGYDERGAVVVQAPEHVIENLQMRRKAQGDPRRMRKLKLKKPPERGYVHWDRHVFDRLVQGRPEPLRSSFRITQGMMLNVLSRPDVLDDPSEDGCRALKELVRRCHEPPSRRRAIGRQAIQMFRSLVASGVVELVPKEGGRPGKRARVRASLQEEFSLNQALSLFVLAAVERLDPEAPDDALRVLSVVESVVETPHVVLARQLDRLKREVLAELKAQGVEYEERVRVLEELRPPKPEADFLYETFGAFRARHPWVGAENVRPKGIAREMLEEGYDFVGYVKEYGLQRAEGVLLRYLTDVYKELLQSVPEERKTDSILEVQQWLGALVASVDASLLEEWERLRDPDAWVRAGGHASAAKSRERDPWEDPRTVRVMLRNAAWGLLVALARRQWGRAAGMLARQEGGRRWFPEDLEAAMAPYFEQHEALRTDMVARGARNVRIEEVEGGWRVEQTLLDEEGEGAGFLELFVPRETSREASRPVLHLRTLHVTA